MFLEITFGHQLLPGGCLSFIKDSIHNKDVHTRVLPPFVARPTVPHLHRCPYTPDHRAVFTILLVGGLRAKDP